MLRTMKNRICTYCTHYMICKFREDLVEMGKKLEVRVDYDSKFRKWLDHFAIYCEYFEYNEVNIDLMIKCGLDSLFHFQDEILKNGGCLGWMKVWEPKYQ